MRAQHTLHVRSPDLGKKKKKKEEEEEEEEKEGGKRRKSIVGRAKKKEAEGGGAEGEQSKENKDKCLSLVSVSDIGFFQAGAKRSAYVLDGAAVHVDWVFVLVV